MKRICLFAFFALVALCGACTQNDPVPADPGAVSPVCAAYRISARVLPMAGGEAAPGSRALLPMTPEEENMIRTIAVLQFDSEDNLVLVADGERPGSESYYYFRNLTEDEDTPNGTPSPELDNVRLQSGDGQRTTICLIANMTEAQIAELILKDDGRTRVQLSDFRRKTVDIGNILTEEDGAGDRNENIGHVKQIYMFGYYEGVLPGTESGLSIYLGRIIARIEVNFTIDDPEDLKKKFYIGLANMETKAYVFPGAQSPNAEDAWLDMKPTERSEEIRTGACQFYFYAAPHSTDVSDKATRLQIWYVDEGTVPSDDNVSATILLCNNPDTKPEDAMEGDYYLNRNSIYHANIHLSEKRDGTPVVRSGCRRR